LRREPPARAPKPCPTVEVEATPPDSACAQKLAACEQRGWDLVMRTIAKGGSPQPGGDDAGAAAPVKLDGLSGPAEQAAMLCLKGQANLRESWIRDREAIVVGLFHSLKNREEQE